MRSMRGCRYNIGSKCSRVLEGPVNVIRTQGQARDQQLAQKAQNRLWWNFELDNRLCPNYKSFRKLTSREGWLGFRKILLRHPWIRRIVVQQYLAVPCMWAVSPGGHRKVQICSIQYDWALIIQSIGPNSSRLQMLSIRNCTNRIVFKTIWSASFNLRVAGYVARARLSRWNWDETVETIPQSGGRVVGVCGGDLDNRGQHGNSNALESFVNWIY